MGDVGQGLGDNAAGDFTALAAAHAVGDNEQSVQQAQQFGAAQDGVTVLIHFAHLADVRLESYRKTCGHGFHRVNLRSEYSVSAVVYFRSEGPCRKAAQSRSLRIRNTSSSRNSRKHAEQEIAQHSENDHCPLSPSKRRVSAPSPI